MGMGPAPLGEVFLPCREQCYEHFLESTLGSSTSCIEWEMHLGSWYWEPGFGKRRHLCRGSGLPSFAGRTSWMPAARKLLPPLSRFFKGRYSHLSSFPSSVPKQLLPVRNFFFLRSNQPPSYESLFSFLTHPLSPPQVFWPLEKRG